MYINWGQKGIPSIADSLFSQLYLISSFGSSSSSSSFFLLFDTGTELGVLAADDYSLKKVIENVDNIHVKQAKKNKIKW